jgi:SAM-dependent methyltransferase
VNAQLQFLGTLCIAGIGVGLLATIGWRLAGRVLTLPCPSWLAWLLENPFNGEANARLAVQRLDLRPGMRVLDAGCGPGRLTVPIAQAVGPQGEVTALDIQPAMLERARRRAAAAHVDNIRFVQAALGKGHLEPAKFDRALLVTVLGEIPRRDAALREIFDALKPGGVLSITELIYDPHFQSRNTILRLASAAGFREQAFFGNRFDFTLNLQKAQGADPL